jgi:hypothetical protein
VQGLLRAPQDGQGQSQEEAFPIHARDYETANRMAFVYVLEILKLDEFELRLVGS